VAGSRWRGGGGCRLELLAARRWGCVSGDGATGGCVRRAAATI